MNEILHKLEKGLLQWKDDILFVPKNNIYMWLLIDLNENTYKGYYSFNRLKKDIGLSKGVEKPSIPLRIGSKYEIREIELDERI